MSKIQKALQQIRQTPRAKSGQNSESRPQSGEPQQSDPRQSTSENQGLRRRNGQPDYSLDHEAIQSAENLPDFLLKVEVSQLVEAGLYPAAEHADQVAQEFRRIKRPVINLAFGNDELAGENANMVMVASALPKSGKTFCSINLAASIARERDIGAVLVDADVLKPNISNALGLADKIGLIDHLLNPSIEIDDIIFPSDFHNVVIIPAGRQHHEATELLASRRMGKFVATLSRRFQSRAVVVDTPPLLLTNEAHVLAEHMGQIVMVIEAGVSKQEAVMQALDSLNKNKPINAILNKSRNGFLGGYGAEDYGYYSVPRRENNYDNNR